MKSRTIRSGSYLGVLFAVTVWGASFIATKIVLKDVSPVTVVWLRFAIGTLILVVFVFIRKQIFIPDLKTSAYFALLGFIGITFHQWLQSTGLITSQAGTTAWIVATTPIFMAFLGWILLRESFTINQVVGILFATLGVILVVSKGDIRQIFAGVFGAPGDVLIVISALNWAVFSILSKYGLRRFPASSMMFYTLLFGWLFITILFINNTGYNEIPQLSTKGWIGVLFLGIACSGFAYIFWFDALKGLPAAQVGSFLYLEPLIAMIVARLLLEESILAASLFGGFAIVLGVWLVNRKEKEN